MKTFDKRKWTEKSFTRMRLEFCRWKIPPKRVRQEEAAVKQIALGILNQALPQPFSRASCLLTCPRVCEAQTDKIWEVNQAAGEGYLLQNSFLLLVELVEIHGETDDTDAPVRWFECDRCFLDRLFLFWHTREMALSPTSLVFGTCIAEGFERKWDHLSVPVRVCFPELWKSEG